MPGPFAGIELAGRALRNFQRALDVTGHNIANVNTRGYSRQVAEFSASEPTAFWSNGQKMIGSGVQISSINRIRDMFLEARMRDGQSDLNQYASLASQLDQVQGVFNEPGENGIANALDKFWNAWSGLASNPSDPGAKMQVRLAGETLASRIRTTYSELTRQSNQIGAEIQSTITEVNDIGQQIHDLNNEIRQSLAQGGQPNDLMDQRDVLVERLSGLVNVTTTNFDDGTMAVYISQHTLVEPAAPPTPLPSNVDFANARAGSIDIKSGRLRGLFDAQLKIEGGTVGVSTVKGYKTMLDDLANELRTQINAVHKTIANPLDITERFFADAPIGNPQTGAVDFDLDAHIKADASQILAGDPTKPGDGSIALQLSAMRDSLQGTLSGKSFNSFYSEMISNLGREAQFFSAKAEAQDSVVSQIETQRQSVSGVSIDDEMANMLRFQRSYQAAAKLLTIFDQVTEDLIGMVRR
ncbi:MAG: flagellar hook-associated protein FlgK [Fimbriimonadaceae bacterium]|nr:flagellar hook-associated protein FlgK [Fimbriimonadaceae bacterium]